MDGVRIFRLVVGWCFGAVAALNLYFFVSLITDLILRPSELDLLRGVFSLVLFALPLGSLILYGMAWWAVIRRKEQARSWVLTASLTTLVLVGATLRFGAHALPWISWVLLGLGTAGLVAFAKEPGEKAEAAESDAAHDDGAYRPDYWDGTNSLLDKAIPFAAFVLMWVLSSRLDRWLVGYGAESPGMGNRLAALAFCMPAMMVIHEGGHLLAGFLVDMRPTQLLLGPFRWQFEEGKWRFRFEADSLFLAGVRVLPTKSKDFKRRKIIQVFGGPAASLISGVTVLVFARSLVLWGGDFAANLVTVFASASIMVGIVNLAPFKIKQGYSDGAKILQLIRGGFRADNEFATSFGEALRRSWLEVGAGDVRVLECVAERLGHPMYEFSVRLWASGRYFSLGDCAEAHRAAKTADLLFKEHKLELDKEWISIRVFSLAFMLKDGVAAREVWDGHSSEECFTPWEGMHVSLCALLWSEGKLDEAEEEWVKAEKWAEKLTEAENGKAQREVVKWMREALNASLQVAGD